MTIQEIKALRAAITPGEWKLFHFSTMDGKVDKAAVYTGNYLSIKPNVRSEDEMVAAGCYFDNAAFIAQTPEIIDQLLTEIERLNDLVKCHETGEFLTKEEERAVYKKMYNYHVCNTGCGMHCSQK